MMSSGSQRPMLWLDSARGRYIPRDFSSSFADRDKHVRNVSKQNWADLEAGPDNEHYWETWEEVTNSATIIDEHDNQYALYQSDGGDLWLIPVGMEWSDEDEFYVWPATPQHTGTENETR